MILLDGTEQEQEGELTPGRRINRYRDRGAAFRKPMAEVEVGDILWDERTSTHWITDEVRYSKPDGNRADDGKGASLYISDGVRGRTFYENQSYYDSILVLSSPNVLLRYRTEALQREHELLLESEKPRNAFTVSSLELRIGDTFLHPTRGWLTVESVVRDRNFELTGSASRRSFMLTDGTEVSTEQIGSQTKVLRSPDRTDIRDTQISEGDFDRILARASKNAELAVRESALAKGAQESPRRPLQGSRPVTLNGVSGSAARIFFDELEEGDIVYWPGAGWQIVLNLMESDTSAAKAREVKAATLSNRVRVTPNLETMLVDVFVPDDGAKRNFEPSMGDSTSSTPQASTLAEHLIPVSSFQLGDEVLTADGNWITLKFRPFVLAEDFGKVRWFVRGEDNETHPITDILPTDTPALNRGEALIRVRRGPQSSVFLWKQPTAVQDGERVLTVDGWIEVKRLPTKESTVYHNDKRWDSMGTDGRFHEVREFKTAKGISLVYAQVSPEEAAGSERQDGPVYSHDQLTGEAVVEGDEARTPAGSWLPLAKVEPEMKRRGGVGRSYLAGYIGTFSYPDATQATGRLSVFRDSQGKLAYEIRRRLSSRDIENLQKGFGA